MHYSGIPVLTPGYSSKSKFENTVRSVTPFNVPPNYQHYADRGDLLEKLFETARLPSGLEKSTRLQSIFNELVDDIVLAKGNSILMANCHRIL